MVIFHSTLLDDVTLPEDNAQNFHLTAIEVDLGTLKDRSAIFRAVHRILSAARYYDCSEAG